MGSRRKVVFEEAAAGVVETVNRRFKELWENPLLVFPQLRQFPQRFSPPQFGYPVGKNPLHKKAPQVSRLGQGPVSANSTWFRSYVMSTDPNKSLAARPVSPTE